MSLFVKGDFKSHAGLLLHWKLECDALTFEDWIGIVAACHDLDLIPANISAIIGVPRGGLVFEQALMAHGSFYWSSAAPRLVVDDVLTTGGSILKLMDRPTDRGLVVFARGPLPPRVRAFLMTESALDYSVEAVQETFNSSTTGA